MESEDSKDKEPTYESLVQETGHCSSQGVRPSMEDEIILKDNIVVNSHLVVGPLSFYGVFDGHGGREAAVFVRDNMLKFLVQQLENKHTQTVEDALTEGFSATDKAFISSTKSTSGTTAVVCLIEHSTNKMWVAHVGDSRAVLCRKGVAIGLTKDHKADREDEVERIRKAGGFVIYKRVMGELAISRAIGDADFKQEDQLKLVIPNPEIASETKTVDDEFVLLACDGLYDVMTNEVAVAHIRDNLERGVTSDQACRAIVRHAVESLRSLDNVSVVIVRFQPGKVNPVIASGAPTHKRGLTGATAVLKAPGAVPGQIAVPIPLNLKFSNNPMGTVRAKKTVGSPKDNFGLLMSNSRPSVADKVAESKQSPTQTSNSTVPAGAEPGSPVSVDRRSRTSKARLSDGDIDADIEPEPGGDKAKQAGSSASADLIV